MEFKHYKEEELYCYMGIAPSPVILNAPGGMPGGASGNSTGGSRGRMRLYLSWAAALSEGKNLWAIIRESPESAVQLGEFQPVRIGWKYDVVANDTEGMGIDKGFVPVQAPYSPLHGDQGGASLFFRLPDPALLLGLSEDALGDADSHATLLALQGEGKHISDLLMRDEVPQAKSMLGAGDLLVNIAVGKEQGYYDSFLVKAGSDIGEALDSLIS